MKSQHTLIIVFSALLLVSCADSTVPEEKLGLFVADSAHASCSLNENEHHDNNMLSFSVTLYYHFEDAMGTINGSCSSISLGTGQFCYIPYYEPYPYCDGLGLVYEEQFGFGKSTDMMDADSATIYLSVVGDFWDCTDWRNAEKTHAFEWSDSLRVEVIDNVE